LRDGRFQLDAELFWWEYEKHQEFVIGPDELGIVGQSIINAGDATIKGASLAMAYALTDVDRVYLNAEYLDATYDDFTYRQSAQFTAPNLACGASPTGVLVPGGGGQSFPELLIDCSGLQMTRASEWTASAGYTHSFFLGDVGVLDASVDVNYVDEQWLSANFLPSQRVDATTVWNATLNYTDNSERYQVTAYIQNISDEAVYGSSTSHSQVYQFVGLSVGAPRTYGVRFRYSF